MKKILLSVSIVALLASLASCVGRSNSSMATDADSVCVDTIMVEEPVAKQSKMTEEERKAMEAEREAAIKKLKPKFRVKTDEFSDKSWVYHNSTPKYTNRNSVHIYFCMQNGVASNLRFRFQYEDDNWLFIKSLIFNIDGENYTYIPSGMQEDCGNGGRIWEWCDAPASECMELVNMIANAKSVKIKYNGRQYYNTRTMTAKQIQAVKETLEYYNLLK